jgi:hypothetical protein
MSTAELETTTTAPATPDTIDTDTSTTQADPHLQSLLDEKFGKEGEAPAGETPTADPPAPASGERPRGPDGKFLSTKPQAPAPSEPAAPATFDDALLAEAEAVGLTAAQAKRHETPEKLREFIASERAKAAPAMAAQVAAPSAPQAAPQTNNAALPLPEEPEEWKDDALLSPTEKFLRDGFRALRSEVESHRARAAQDAEARENEAFERDTAAAESFIKDTLGDDWRDVYGPGDMTSLRPDGPYARERRELFSKAAGLAAVMPGADIKERLEAANFILHRQDVERLIQRRYAEGLRKQAENRTADSAAAPRSKHEPHTGKASEDPVILAYLEEIRRENGN